MSGFAPVRAAVTRLTLNRFRSYAAARAEFPSGMVVLTGANGAGKTNILEALSLFAGGRGLRRATMAELAHAPAGAANALPGWAVAAEVEGALGLSHLGTGAEGIDADTPVSRKCRIDREPVASAAAFADHLRLVWLTPDMDGLFRGAAGERRRFLDRLVLAVDAGHGSRVNALEKALRSRNRLLEDPGADARWLDAIEHEVAELALAVAASRAETVRRLTGAIAARRDPASPFPWADIALEGELEAAVLTQPAASVEDDYRRTLRDARPRDRAAGRTLIGPHASDLIVAHGPKGEAAERCSTGEQKALLTGLVLAHARLVADMTGIVPILLLDEVAAHFDPERRAALFAVLDSLGAQAFMTGADPAAFAELGQARHYHVLPGRITAV